MPVAALSQPRRSPWFYGRIALAIVPVNVGVWFLAIEVSWSEGLQAALLLLFVGFAAAQFVLGLIALVAGVRLRRATGHVGLAAAVVGLLAAVGAVLGGLGGAAVGMFAMGGGWGRPLRVRGRQVHPELREGADWTLGEQPDPSGLDEPLRICLEALWLHDAQKEHASVPAFARVSWLLAATGAPAELVAWSHRAALEEIAHTRLCFALAAGYGGRSHTVQPMPELLVAGLDIRGNALVVLAHESLGDGCQLEDFNADIAAECALVCEEPATRAVLARIAREERSHADFSWAVIGWLLERDPDAVRPALAQAVAELPTYARPTAVSWRKRHLVARADAVQLRRYGRLPDERWGELWQLRLSVTTARVGELLDSVAAAAQ